YLKPPEKEFIEKNSDTIKMITIAPEVSDNFIPWAVDKKIIVSLGHSTAKYEEACMAFEKGATQVTHLFNGMSGIHHREPGLAGAALLCPNIKVEIIADTIHFRKELFPLICRMKDKRDIILVTDCMRAGGMPPGEYLLGNLAVHTTPTSARLADDSLAGSVLTMNKAIYLFHKHTSMPLYDVIAMASYNPACHLGIAHERGSIQVGLYADLVLVDHDMNVHKTIIEGKSVYSSSHHRVE
ncbi:MAG: amidohydrolase family protein, partial [Clostridia bacterium]|nr:amidohydrolase family protein [Clostridia bacterium]